MTYYHVASSAYESGDLLCYDELERLDRNPAWKWECDLVDTDVVCLFSTITEAQDYLDEFGGKILTVEFPDWIAEELSFTKVSEGYAAVYTRIPAQYIK